ncbi:hypothetical protein [Embleya sp. NPDC050493]|uniref:hypothetical protein n=1 Tax=Embleya sp. NPDC050493 TaxID=3363989 RepID=UPI0037BD5477
MKRASRPAKGTIALGFVVQIIVLGWYAALFVLFSEGVGPNDHLEGSDEGEGETSLVLAVSGIIIFADILGIRGLFRDKASGATAPWIVIPALIGQGVLAVAAALGGSWAICALSVAFLVLVLVWVRYVSGADPDPVDAIGNP